MFETEKLICTVQQLNEYIKNVFSRDENLRFILVKGEISNFKIASNGHMYFSLKDAKSQISAVMFNDAARFLNFVPKNGDEVIVVASVSVYEVRGTYQLYIKQMEKRGLGQLLVELEELKKKLAAEGLFDERKKRKINLYPENIGIISALNSAALEDILTNLKRRYPIANLYVFPSAVQGDNAPKELLKAFHLAQEYPLDTLIIGRGGGSSEDLSAFNDETLTRAVSSSRMPVIAAIGHEVDFTLVEYAADARASTPTGAAEKATVDKREIEQYLFESEERLKELLKNNLKKVIENVEDISKDLDEAINRKLSDYQTSIKNLESRLISLNPKQILKRGFSILTNSDGKVITSYKDVEPGDKIKNTLIDGDVYSEVKERGN